VPEVKERVMKDVRTRTCGAGLLVLLLAFSAGAAEAEEAEVKIGVVDVIRVFDAYERSEDLEKELQGEAKGFSNKMESMKEELKRLEAEIELLSPEHERRVEAVSELAMKRQVYQSTVMAEQKKLMARQSKMLVEVYDEIAVAVEEYAKVEGYTLVLKAESKDVRGDTPDEVQLRIAVRPVLYYSSVHDLTDDIIRVLNAKYEAEKKAAAEKVKVSEAGETAAKSSEEPTEPQEKTGGTDSE